MILALLQGLKVHNEEEEDLEKAIALSLMETSFLPKAESARVLQEVAQPSDPEAYPQIPQGSPTPPETQAYLCQEQDASNSKSPLGEEPIASHEPRQQVHSSALHSGIPLEASNGQAVGCSRQISDEGHQLRGECSGSSARHSAESGIAEASSSGTSQGQSFKTHKSFS